MVNVEMVVYRDEGAVKGSEDKFIDVASAATGEQICSVPTQTLINAIESWIAWHPNSPTFGFANGRSVP